MEPLVTENLLNAPAPKIWDALTDKEKMKEWYFELPEFRAEPGFYFEFEGGTEACTYMHLCEVTEVVPGKKLAHSWRYEGYEGNSQVTFELFEEENATRVRLTHSGLETFPTDVPDFARENFEAGWNDIIGRSLKEYVETARIVNSIEIKASPANTWAVLTEDESLRQWASAFSEGTWAETTWAEGTEMKWNHEDGSTGAKGIILIHQPASLLKAGFYDDVNSEPPTPLGAYTEIFALAEKEGSTILSIDAGPLPLKHLKIHAPLWEKALALIKQMAEAK